MSVQIAFTPLVPADHEPIARLLHRSLVQWYESRLGQGARFGASHEPFLLFPQIYEALDPGECITARDLGTGDIVGVCFTHLRETHLSIGIVSTAPEAAGRGLARQMMQLALEKAAAEGKPARLVSSLLNLDSFSLYTRMGFIPGRIFQDLSLSVPETGMPGPVPIGRVRAAAPTEAARLADLELAQNGIRREKDLAFFLRNEVGAWRVLVSEDEAQELTGYLALSTHPAGTMIGPGVAVDEPSAIALLWHALDLLRGRSVVFLVPCDASSLVRAAYSWGARNVELHVAQSTEAPVSTPGIVFPTFLPESA